jgi:hypothetical protein
VTASSGGGGIAGVDDVENPDYYVRGHPHEGIRVSPPVARCYQPAMLGRGDRHALPLLCYPGRSGDRLRPEEGLVVAVLEHAVGIFQRYAFSPERTDRLLFADIDAWFASSDIDYPFAFVSICDVLGLDVAYVRLGLRQWYEGGRKALRGNRDLSRVSFHQPAVKAMSHLRAVPAPSALGPPGDRIPSNGHGADGGQIQPGPSVGGGRRRSSRPPFPRPSAM